MNRIPEPLQTPQGPAYEGRLLVHADEEVVDQGASFDIGTLLTRRRVLGLGVLGAGALALAACSPTTTSGSTGTTSGSTSTDDGSSSGSSTSDGAGSASSGTTTSTELPSGEIPDETAGPYPGDGSNGPDVLEQSGIVRSDIRASLDTGTTAEGVPTTLNLTVLDMANDDVPFTDVAVYAWHCDAQGLYSMYSEGVEDETYLRGVQVTDADGVVTFTSIFPACYTGRWPHIHFEVYPDLASITDATNAIATSQVALPQDACDAVYALSAYSGSSQNLSQVTLDSDNVFGEDGGALQLATTTGDPTTGYTVSLTVRVDTTTTPELDAAPSGAGGGERPGS